MRCVARYGVSKTTLDDVAKEAGCARATIYRYFPSRDDLVAACLTDRDEHIRGAYAGAAAQEQDPAQLLRLKSHAGAHHQATHALRPVKFVRGHGEKVDAQLSELAWLHHMTSGVFMSV